MSIFERTLEECRTKGYEPKWLHISQDGLTEWYCAANHREFMRMHPSENERLEIALDELILMHRGHYQPWETDEYGMTYPVDYEESPCCMQLWNEHHSELHANSMATHVSSVEHVAMRCEVSSRTLRSNYRMAKRMGESYNLLWIPEEAGRTRVAV